MPRKLRLLGGQRYVAQVDPSPDIELTSLLFSANFFDKDTAEGTVLADLMPAPEVGETRAFAPATDSSDDVYLNETGTQILRGSGSGWTSAGDISYDVRRTLVAAINSPLDTTWDVTLYTPGDIPVVEVGAAWNGTADSGWDGSPPTSSVLDTTTVRAVINLAVSWHETITGDTLLCFDAGAAFDSVSSVDALVEGNSVNIPEPSWQMITDPRDSSSVPLYGYWFKLIKPTADSGTIRVRGRANTSNPGIAATISAAYDFYPRAAAYDVKKTVAYSAIVHPTADYTGSTALTQALNYKGANDNETVWIEILDNPPTLGWNVGEPANTHLAPTTWTKIYGAAGQTIRIGDYTDAGTQCNIDGIWWGENLQLDISAIGNGSAAFNMVGTRRVKFWGTSITGGNPGSEGGSAWSGNGASALYKRRQPSGFFVYPATNLASDCTIVAGFCDYSEMPAFGPGYAKLAIYNTVDGVSGSCFEGPRGPILFNTARAVGGRQAGLRGYNPAIRIVADRTMYPYVAIEKTPTNGNVIASGQVPSTLTTAGSGYTDGVFDAGKGKGPRWACTGGSGTEMLFDVVVSGGVVTSAKCVKSTLMGSGYQPGDVVTLVQSGVTPTTPATVTLGSTFRLYGGASEATATIIGEMLLYAGMSHLDVVAMLDAIDGIAATSLSPAHDLDVSFLTYDAQPSAGVSVANEMSKAIVKRTWSGSTFDLSLGQDIHSDVVVYPGDWLNFSVRFNTFIDYIESAPFSFGKSSKVNGAVVTHNCWYDTTATISGLTAQQGYMQGGPHPHLVFRHNTQVSASATIGTGGWFFGSLFSVPAGGFFDVSQNLIDGFGWSVPRDDDVIWHNNLHRNRTQTQVDALTATPAADGDSRGLGGASIASLLPNLLASDSFVPSTAARLSDLSWAGALDSSGNYAGIAPAP